INPFWFFFLAWYAGLMALLVAVQLWKKYAKRAVEKHGVLLGGDTDSHTIVTYMSDGQLTIRSEPMTPPPTTTVSSAFRMDLERLEEEKEPLSD
ncbi:hypothetical protein PENTCL1PPCAC_5866, partial [Pristionchus entomophagus]